MGFLARLACGVAVLGAAFGIAAPRLEPAGPTEVRTSGQRVYSDPAQGVTVAVPRGWRVARRLTAMAFPRELLTLASFPLRRGGSCGPDRALEDLPARGALIFVLEYRPQQGKVWSGGVRRESFPRRPVHLRLARGGPQAYECFGGLGYLLVFRDADRPFQVMVALGSKATGARRRAVERILDRLRFVPLPEPPPDPYAGWPTLIDESGDSLRAPPGWTSLVTAIPRRLMRPRTLFLTASHRLAGLPRDRRRVAALPAPAVTPGLAQLPSDAVVLWLTEERRGGPSPRFRPFASSRPWPAENEFRVVKGDAAKRWPSLTFRRAGLSWRGLRFAAWVAAGPAADSQDVALAQKAAVSVGLSSALRDCRPGNRRGACRRPLERRLLLRQAPYLGVNCRRPNRIACDHVGLAVSLRRPALSLTATIDGRRFELRPPATRAGYWEGTLRHVGLLRPGAALHVIPDRGRYYWAGRHPVRAVVRLSAIEADGASAELDVAVDLQAGYG